MSKFTQEDLLNAMELKVGDRIQYSFYKSPVTVSYNDVDGYYLLADNGKFLYLHTLIDHDYIRIIQPKYTLTETEKHIVLAIDEKWNWIARSRMGNLFVAQEAPLKTSLNWGDVKFQRTFDMFNHHFQFIQWSDPEPVSLDELRQIAKGETK